MVEHFSLYWSPFLFSMKHYKILLLVGRGMLIIFEAAQGKMGGAARSFCPLSLFNFDYISSDFRWH